MLRPAQFPLMIPKLIASKIPPFEIFAKAIKDATQAGMFSEDAFWMVAEGQELRHLLAMLNDYVVREVTQKGTIAERVALSHLLDQMEVVEVHLYKGWQEGLCVPWGIVGRYPSQQYKVHMTRLVREKAEPYRLKDSGPICKVQTKGPTSIHSGQVVDCRGCLALRQSNPSAYLMVEGTR